MIRPLGKKFLLSAWKSFEFAECLKGLISIPAFLSLEKYLLKLLYAQAFAGLWEYTKNEQGRGAVTEIMTPGREERKALLVFPVQDGEPRLGSTDSSFQYKHKKMIFKITEEKAAVGGYLGNGLRMMARESSCSKQKAQHRRRGHSCKRVQQI